MIFLVISAEGCEPCDVLKRRLKEMGHKVIMFSLSNDDERNVALEFIIKKGIYTQNIVVPQTFVKLGDGNTVFDFKFLFLGNPEDLQKAIEMTLNQDEFENRKDEYKSIAV